MRVERERKRGERKRGESVMLERGVRRVGVCRKRGVSERLERRVKG